MRGVVDEFQQRGQTIAASRRQVFGQADRIHVVRSSRDDFVRAAARIHPQREIDQAGDDGRIADRPEVETFAIAAGDNPDQRLPTEQSVPLGPVFVVDVTAESGAFSVAAAGIGAGATGALEVPKESERQPLDAFTAALADAVTSALDATGLYHDEAVAMVNTWQRQWFLTPGLRVFYLAPQAWTDAVLPLTLDPIPDELVRVMVVRVELLTPEVEADDARAVELLATDAASARDHCEALGRFAEPRLRRALELAPSAAGDAYLSEFAPQVPRASGL